MGTRYRGAVDIVPARDHPHAYGDKSITSSASLVASGSSPRVWGQASILLKSARTSKDHPHAYGDKDVDNLRVLDSAGSSPRVWGQESLSLTISGNPGIIPTRMGTSTLSSRYAIHKVDHPHAYGDKFSNVNFDCFLSGSSPRVWGQGTAPPFRVPFSGIIPTRMGTSVFTMAYSFPHWDHPHAYGDKVSKR